MTDKPYAFRAYINDDIPFIMSSWGKSFYKGRSFKTFLSPSEFTALHRPVTKAFFSRPTSTVILCVSEKDPSLIMGWAAIEKAVRPGIILHYVYVKEAFKKEGIASQLLAKALPINPVYYTHLTSRASYLMDLNKERYSNYQYEPAYIYGET